eukprot:gene16285-17923_t
MAIRYNPDSIEVVETPEPVEPMEDGFLQITEREDCLTQQLAEKNLEIERLNEQLNQARAIDGNIVDEDEFLLDLVKSSKGKAFKERSKVVDVELYFAQNCENDCPITQQTSLGTVSFIGKLFSQSYLHTKATKGEAVRALKCDIIRSILSRLQLLCEEAEDSLQRFSELLSITAIEEDLLFLEKFPDRSECDVLLHKLSSSSFVWMNTTESTFENPHQQLSITEIAQGALKGTLANVVGDLVAAQAQPEQRTA